jgi:hypothetical protein
MLVPIQESSEIEAALAYLLSLDEGASDIQLAILHVTAPADEISCAAQPCHAEMLLEQAESRCRAKAVAHESYILAGELVFSILDASELLACDAIVMAVPKRRPWHFFFPPKTVREMQRLRGDLPLVLIDANGAVIRSM